MVPSVRAAIVWVGMPGRLGAVRLSGLAAVVVVGGVPNCLCLGGPPGISNRHAGWLEPGSLGPGAAPCLCLALAWALALAWMGGWGRGRGLSLGAPGGWWVGPGGGCGTLGGVPGAAVWSRCTCGYFQA